MPRAPAYLRTSLGAALAWELLSEVFPHPGEWEQPVIQVSVPAAPGSRQQTQRLLLLRPLGTHEKRQEDAVSPLRVVRYVEERLINGAISTELALVRFTLLLGPARTRWVIS